MLQLDLSSLVETMSAEGSASISRVRFPIFGRQASSRGKQSEARVEVRTADSDLTFGTRTNHGGLTHSFSNSPPVPMEHYWNSDLYSLVSVLERDLL